jgi:hypothetical protein
MCGFVGVCPNGGRFVFLLVLFPCACPAEVELLPAALTFVWFAVAQAPAPAPPAQVGKCSGAVAPFDLPQWSWVAEVPVSSEAAKFP